LYKLVVVFGIQSDDSAELALSVQLSKVHEGSLAACWLKLKGLLVE
jgi:hypothetical protein